MRNDDESFVDGLQRAIDGGLKAQGVDLLEADKVLLREQIREQIGTVRRAEGELQRLKPDAVLVPADDHPPFIEYVLVARREGVPTVMLQHGLDCERHHLDEAHASHIAVWGDERKRRYERGSRHQPKELRVVGNPAYDRQRFADTIRPCGNTWLWLTRPHRSEKCYPPSREPGEGLRILDSLLVALERQPEARILIKAHTFDRPEAYRSRLETHPNRERVSFPPDGLFNLIESADVTITEDSTVGMDAMVKGRILVHAHLADSEPVMPFVEYGAALPGFSSSEIMSSLARARHLDAAGRADMHAGQQRFLDEFAGPRDGKAGERFGAFVQETVMEQRSRNQRMLGRD